MKIGIVAGEASGDALGAQLMHALRQQHSDVEFLGVGGTQMATEGLESLESFDRFSFNGFLEPIKRLPELLGLIASLADRLAHVDVMIGVDFNVFNLKLEKQLKARGVPTVHYVSPSVYAWRRGRANRIERSTDLLLTLYPFEPQYYNDAQIRTVFVGHPLADEIDPTLDRESSREHARQTLGLSSSAAVVALLLGSRYSEVNFHKELFLETCERFRTKLNPDLCQFVVPSRHAEANAVLRHEQSHFPEVDLRITDKSSQQVLVAADVALVKSGTSTLEAMLIRTPMVVTYRIGWLTYAIVRSLLHTPRVALPNILANREVVPEFIQHRATAEILASQLATELRRSRSENDFFAEYDRLHHTLRQNNADKAASAVLELIGQNVVSI
ncbi:MAG: lipid-A-disaccharide synthase [Gammaproteobacteria bacterium]|nr:lipid-A-disaccharide synthase [Gammaproteobacteria bacterium]MYI76742.1 lipid-A-disaccharide synthase [Gammaproteobacteria bacterium]